VPRIGGGAFSEANRFRGFYSLLGDWEGVVFIPPTVREIGGGFTFYHCPTPGELTIPSGVTRIYNLTFFESPVVRLILPDTVTSVDRNALSYSYNDYSIIQELIFEGSPPAEPFASQGTIYRLPGATGWSNSFGAVPVQIFLKKATVTGMSPASGFQFSWSGTGTFPVNVERAPSPGGPWTVVSSNNTNGQFTDPAPPSGSAFYRAQATIPWPTRDPVITGHRRELGPSVVRRYRARCREFRCRCRHRNERVISRFREDNGRRRDGRPRRGARGVAGIR